MGITLLPCMYIFFFNGKPCTYTCLSSHIKRSIIMCSFMAEMAEKAPPSCNISIFNINSMVNVADDCLKKSRLISVVAKYNEKRIQI